MVFLLKKEEESAFRRLLIGVFSLQLESGSGLGR
jgi:hypothetical protein